MNSIKKYPLTLISTIFLTVLPILFSSVLVLLTLNYQERIDNFGWVEWAVVTLICCFTSMIALTPPTFLALIFGYFLGWKSVIPLLLLNMVAIYLVYQFTKAIDKDRFRNYLSENAKVKNILESIKQEELKLIFFTKLSPVLPFALLNFVFSLSGAKLKNILLGGFMGMIPRTLLAVWTATQAKEIKTLLENPNGGNTEKIVIISLVFVSVIGIFYFFSKSLKNKKGA